MTQALPTVPPAEPAPRPAGLDALFGAGLAAHRAGALGEALVIFAFAAALDPGWDAAWQALGVARAQTGRPDLGLDPLARAARLAPAQAEIWRNMAQALIDMGADPRPAASRALILGPGAPGLAGLIRQICAPGPARRRWAWRAARSTPTDAVAWLNAANAAADDLDQAPAREALARSLALAPGWAPAWSNAAAILDGATRGTAAAGRAARRALSVDPLSAEAWTNAGLSGAGLSGAASPTLPSALAAHATALALRPAFAAAWHNLANALMPAGRAEAALPALRHAVAIDPDFADGWHNLLFGLHYPARVAAAEIAAAHRAFGARHPRAHRPARRAAGSPLRVGFVSADLGQHSIAHFLCPLLAALDHARVTPILYANRRREDAVSARLRALSAGWRPIADRDDASVADLVAADGIDVLIDLSGHTGGNRLGLFARRPAPFQATWLGYPDTTGLEAIDIRLTDAIADPPGAEAFATERLVRLDPGFLCYEGPSDRDPGPCPADASGVITFGSFNNLAKLTREQAALWASILHAAPDARLMLKAQGFADPDVAHYWTRVFQDLGIAPERLSLLSWVPDTVHHLDLYRRVDVALDTHPYAGTTTTCDAFFMGVPVVSLVGDRHAARMGASLLDQVGLADLAAPTPEAYREAALSLAADRARRAHLRIDLRRRMREGPLGDAPGLARRLTEALEALVSG